MVDKHGGRFLCYLPKEEKATSGWTSTPQNISTVMMETHKQVKLKTPDELLQPLTEKCLFRVRILKMVSFHTDFQIAYNNPSMGLQQEGWWSYEFCHQKFVRQVHIEDENKVCISDSLFLLFFYPTLNHCLML